VDEDDVLANFQIEMVFVPCGFIPKMPRDGAIIFSDLIGKCDALRVACDKCKRDGCYGLSRLIDKRDRDGKVIDWLDEITADLPVATKPYQWRIRGI
jgi:hypothetical protein